MRNTYETIRYGKISGLRKKCNDVKATLIKNVTRYDKITSKNMMEEVIREYHQIDVISNYMDYEEYE